MIDLSAAVERTLAARHARMRMSIVREGQDEWWPNGRASTDMVAGHTHLVFRPIPPDAPDVGIPPETEYEYLFDGGRRWARGPNGGEWHAPLGAIDGPRQIADPLWALDGLRGATTVRAPLVDGDPITALLDLAVAEQAVGHRIDGGGGRLALLLRPRLRRWRRAVPARVWLDSDGRLTRVEHMGPPYSRRFRRHWIAVDFMRLGDPVALPTPRQRASA